METTELLQEVIVPGVDPISTADLVNTYVNLDIEIKKLEAQQKIIKDALLQKEEKEFVASNGYTVKRATRNNVKLKEGVDENTVMTQFPEAVEQKLSMSKLGKIPAAHEVLELQQTQYFICKDAEKF